MFSSIRNLRAPAAIIGLSVLSLMALPAMADTYTYTIVSHTQHEDFYGIDGSSNFVVDITADPVNPCGGGTCYATHYGSLAPVYSVTAPILAYDNGSACAPVLFAGFSPAGASHGRCNNGHAIAQGGDAAHPFGVWVGSDPIADLLLIGTFDGGYMNSRGDAVFIDAYHDTLVFAQDLSSVPEPSSLLLLGTGCLSLLGTLRRFTRT